MKLKSTLILGSLLFISVASFAQDKKTNEQQAATPAQSQADKEMAAWMAYMTPGAMHKMLASSDGEWKEELTFWMEPGGTPTKAEAMCTNTMVMGGRYQESIHKGDMMGQPFEGKGTCAYDNARKVFQSTWIDNMGTGIMIMEGKYDEKTKTLNLSGTMVDAMTGKTEKVREVIKFIDERTQIMEMYMTKNGKEFKNMEIKFTKV